MGSSLGKIFIFLLILGGIFTYLLTGARLFGKVKSSAVQIEMKSIDRTIRGKFFLSNKYPKSSRDFRKLLSASSSKKTGKIGYDPWGVEYVYERHPDKKGYTIISAGLNKKFGDDDDVILTRSKRNVEVEVRASHIKPAMIASQQKTSAHQKEFDPSKYEKLIKELNEYLEVDTLVKVHLEEDINNEINTFVLSIAKEAGIE